MPQYKMSFREPCGGSSEKVLDAYDLDTAKDIASEDLLEWLDGGEWGIEGASVSGDWQIRSMDGELLAEGQETVDIPPDEEALMKKAGADPDCNHKFTKEGEGGCRENPGVWSEGGTRMMFRSLGRLVDMSILPSFLNQGAMDIKVRHEESLHVIPVHGKNLGTLKSVLFVLGARSNYERIIREFARAADAKEHREYQATLGR